MTSTDLPHVAKGPRDATVLKRFPFAAGRVVMATSLSWLFAPARSLPRAGRGRVAARPRRSWSSGWCSGRSCVAAHAVPRARQLTPLHRAINDFNDALGASRNTNPLFLYFFNEIRLVVDEFTTFIQGLIAQPAFGRPVPLVGWLGVVAIVGYVS